MIFRVAIIAVCAALLLSGCGTKADMNASSSDAPVTQSPSDVVQAAAQAFADGFNNDDLTQFNTFFATSAQGADQIGLNETQVGGQTALTQAQSGDQFQLQDFQILSEDIGQNRTEATVHYRAVVSIVRNQTESVFAATVEQNVGLIEVNNQWLISGGDTPQITATISGTPSAG